MAAQRNIVDFVMGVDSSGLRRSVDLTIVGDPQVQNGWAIDEIVRKLLPNEVGDGRTWHHQPLSWQCGALHITLVMVTTCFRGGANNIDEKSSDLNEYLDVDHVLMSYVFHRWGDSAADIPSLSNDI